MILSDPDEPKFGRFANGKPKKGDPKTLFRQGQQWKDFRALMIHINHAHCELCGCHYTGKRVRQLQVHHLDPDNYYLLNPASFSVLCSSCHDMIERFVTMIKGKNWVLPINYREWWALVGLHLSKEAREKMGALIEIQKTKEKELTYEIR